MERRNRDFSIPSPSPQPGEDGVALLIAIVGLSIFSLIGLYLVFNATTEVRVSDNYETQMQAHYAAEAGMNHAREILRSLAFDDLLKGPDGTYDNSTSYLTQAKTYAFRYPVPLATARSLNIFDPSSDLGGIADDGIITTGKVGITNGTPLIPLTGIVITAPNPYGSGTITTARYFVKVADNNGEASELLKDISNNPFIDGDGVVVVRSMGVSRTVSEVSSSGTVRANSVATVEARFKSAKQFNMDNPMVVQGAGVQPAGSNMFSGNSFNIEGTGNWGLSTIDTNTSDGSSPYNDIYNSLAPNQYNNITGMGTSPSMSDITASVTADADKSKLLDPAYLYNFVTYTAPGFADNIIQGPVHLSGNQTQYDLGYYNYAAPYNSPGQRPKTTVVNGDLELSGGIEGGGLLIVTGKLTGSGSLKFNGLVLVVGAGITDLSGVNVEIHGGVYTVNVSKDPITGIVSFGTAKISLSGNSDIIFDSATIQMGVSQIPAVQLSWREIRSGMDP